MQRSGELIDHLQQVVGTAPSTPRLELCTVQRLLGIDELADAVLIAYGEQPCDDDDVWQRWGRAPGTSPRHRGVDRPRRRDGDGRHPHRRGGPLAGRGPGNRR